MRYHWIRDQVKLRVFKITWKAGIPNLADFFTKAHHVKHHLDIRWKYVLMEKHNIASSEGVLIHVLKITWKADIINLADFFTKAHPVKHHLDIRWKYVLMEKRNITSSEGVLIHA